MTKVLLVAEALRNSSIVAPFPASEYLPGQAAAAAAVTVTDAPPASVRVK